MQRYHIVDIRICVWNIPEYKKAGVCKAFAKVAQLRSKVKGTNFHKLSLQAELDSLVAGVKMSRDSRNIAGAEGSGFSRVRAQQMYCRSLSFVSKCVQYSNCAALRTKIAQKYCC